MCAMDSAKAKDAISNTEDLQITAFDWDRDFQDVLQIIDENRAALIPRKNFDTVKMLEQLSFYPEYPEKNGSAMFTVARNKEKVLGVVGSCMLDVVSGHFALIAVANEYRRQGIATKLIDTAGAELIEKNASLICACMRKNHPVGPHLFEKFAKKKGFELIVTEGIRNEHVTLSNRAALGSTKLTIGHGQFE